MKPTTRLTPTGVALLYLALLLLAGCGLMPPRLPSNAVVTAYTHVGPNGNHFVEGRGDLPGLTPIDIPLKNIPIWITAVPFEEGAVWAATLIDGETEAFKVSRGEVTPFDLPESKLPPGTPPVLHLQDGVVRLILPVADSSQLSHPVVLNEKGDLAYIARTGEVVVQLGDTITRLDVNALVDGRLVQDEKGRLLALTDPVGSYATGGLGDLLEPTRLVLIETRPTPRVARTLSMPEGYVIEGLFPMWVDINGDETLEIIVTRASLENGAQIVVLNEQGEVLSEGLTMGVAYQWTHQVAVAPFGPDQSLGLVEVQAPHGGGVVNFYQWAPGQLRPVDGLPGYSSHVKRSRNLDLAVAGDFDDDDQIGLLMPNFPRTELGYLELEPEGVVVSWTLPLEGKLFTNTAVTTLPDGCLAVGVGREDKILRLWQP